MDEKRIQEEVEKAFADYEPPVVEISPGVFQINTSGQPLFTGKLGADAMLLLLKKLSSENTPIRYVEVRPLGEPLDISRTGELKFDNPHSDGVVPDSNEKN